MRFGKKVYLGWLAVCVLLCLCEGCQSHRHYRAYLFKETDANLNMYTIQPGNEIPLPKDTYLKVDIRDVKMGIVHYAGSGPFRDKWHAWEGDGGQDLWLVVDVTNLDNEDPLALNTRRSVHISNVKVDRESFAFVLLDDEEATVLDEKLTSSVAVEFTLYVVNGYKFKRMLAKLSQDKSISGWFWDSTEFFVQQLNNLLTKEIVAALTDAQEHEPLLVERLLLSADGAIVFQGRVEFLVRDCETKQASNYALNDLDKQTEDIGRAKDNEASDTGTSKDSYKDNTWGKLLQRASSRQGEHVTFPSRGSKLTNTQLAMSYITFAVKCDGVKN